MKNIMALTHCSIDALLTMKVPKNHFIYYLNGILVIFDSGIFGF